MKLASVVCLLILVALTLTAADKTPDAGVLDRWVGGKWVSDGQFVDSAFSKANKANGVTTCVWSPDHVFVICDQNINFGGTPLRELSIYTFAPSTNKFYFYGVSLGEEKPRSTALEITENGDHWVYSSTDQIKEKAVQFRTVNQFHDHDNAEWWSEFSTDGGKTWTKSGQGKQTRQK